MMAIRMQHRDLSVNHTDKITRSNIEVARTAIAILVYNGWDMVLQNIATMSKIFDDIWIIDNASTIDMSKEFAIKFPNIKYLRLNNNYGWAGGYNRGLEQICNNGYTSAFILNSDALVDSQSVNSAVSALINNDHTAAVGSIIIENEGTFLAYDGRFRTNNEYNIYDEKIPDLKPANYIHGAGFALSLSAYRDIGPFHEPYFLYHEESDWCAQARRKGYNIFVSGKSVCHHKGVASSTNENREYYLTRNTFLALKRDIALENVPNNWFDLIIQGCNFPKNDKVLAAAHADGLLDGALSRFGKRHRSWNPISRYIFMNALKLLSINIRIFRKMRIFISQIKNKRK